MSKTPWWLAVSLLLTVALCGYSLSLRHRAESRNKAVTLAVEMAVVKKLAAAEGIEPLEALAGMRAQGISAVVLAEQTVADLEARGDVSFSKGRMLFREELADRMFRGLLARYPNFPRPEGSALGMVSTPLKGLDVGMIRATSLGLDADDTGDAKAAGMAIVARLSNPDGAKISTIENSLDWASGLGATYFLAQGDAVLGRRDGIGVFVEKLRSLGMTYCAPEFARISGDAGVIERAPDLVVRLHTAQGSELDKLTPSGALERFAKAVSERNHRMLLLRPLSDVSASPFDSFTEFTRSLRIELAKEGYPMGPAKPFEGAEVPRWLFVLIGLSTVPAVFWLLTALPLPVRLSLVGAGLVTLLALACWIDTGRQFMALLAATGYPLLAIAWYEKARPKPWLAYLAIPAISLIGGLCVSGLLNGLPFMVKADVFSGVKIAHFLPIGLIGVWLFWRWSDGKAALASPATWRQLGLGALLLVGFAFMASRTGNDGPAGVSPLELQFRSLLEQFFVVRPRTKEFLIGFPALVMALALRHRFENPPAWLSVLFMLGAIGTTSIVNTMCHLHTPLSVGLTRIGVGWLVGGILGAFGWGIVRSFGKLGVKN